MAFKIALSPTYKAEVVVILPNDKGGNDKSTMKVTFNRYTGDELEVMRDLTQAEVLQRAVVNVEDLIADDGQKVEFNPETLEILIGIPQALKAIATTFWETQYGARQKN